MKECPLGQFRAGARGSTLLDHTRRIHGTRRRDKASSIPDTCYSPPTISCAFAGVYDLREIPRRFDMREFVAVLPQSCGKLTTSNTAVPFGGRHNAATRRKRVCMASARSCAAIGRFLIVARPSGSLYFSPEFGQTVRAGRSFIRES